MNHPTFGSVFAGIGGLDLGFERAGWRCSWQCEIDAYARSVLARHWPDVKRYEDVRQMNEETPRVDAIIGGFPCQDISVAGKRVGIRGERSGLFFDLMRLVRLVRPRVVVLENVAALVGRGLGDVLSEIHESGFDAEWDCIPALAVGAPHQRDRVFIVAYASISSERRPSAGRRIAREEEVVSDAASRGLARRAVDDTGRRESGLAQRRGANVGHADRASAHAHASRRGSWRPACESSWWLPQPGLGGASDGLPEGVDAWERGVPRVTTERADRVNRLRCLGNAVVPQVAEHVARIALERLA